MSPARKKLPKYLEKYIAVQNYDSYTSRDQAAWRYIMRQNREFFREHAVPIYIEGLKKTGISIDHIPRISEMDECLSKFGWGAVPVKGFIPPAAFLDFQARGVLPIACDMRTVQHLAYTPAPDIVHEAAGHAPIIADPAYAHYLHRYAAMAQKAIASMDDIRVYEAIRYLSDIKENPDTAPGEITKAEAHLKEVGASVKKTSETTMVTRMAWWTVEYGLVGKIQNPKIYGAGLLSSVGESQNCLSSKVKKIPLSVDCVYQSYDITEPQPQLFVTPTLEYLVDVLEDLENKMAFRIGGTGALKTCVDAQTVNTVELDSGIQISGKLVEYLYGSRNDESFLKFSGPVQISYGGEQLEGQGSNRHASGFSGPIGRWKAYPQKSPSLLSADELRKAGILLEKKVQIEFVNEFIVEGILKKVCFQEGKLLYLTFIDCTVRRGSELYFQPEWGEFDLAVGEKVIGAFGGPADPQTYGDVNIGSASTSPARTSPFSKEELSLFSLYEQIKDLREQTAIQERQIETLASTVLKKHAEEWLLEIELLEIAVQKLSKPSTAAWVGDLKSQLSKNQKELPPPTDYLIEKGLKFLKVTD